MHRKLAAGGERAARAAASPGRFLLAFGRFRLGLFEPDRERRVAEAALGQAPVQRHLAAFEALDAHAGARGLALAAATAGLAHAGADATPDAHAVLARARPVGDLVEFHGSRPLNSLCRPRAPDAAACGSCRESTACPADP